MKPYLDELVKHPLGAVVGPLAIIVGFGVIWIWLRGKGRSGWDFLAVITSAFGWIVATLVLSQFRVRQEYGFLVSFGIVVGCWWAFNRVQPKKP